MRHVLATSVLAAWTISGFGAEPPKTPTSDQIVEKGQSAYAVEQRNRETPIRFEHDCPAPEVIDVVQSSSWNSVEIGLSFPTGESWGEVKPYTRYTCPAPSVKQSR